VPFHVMIVDDSPAMRSFISRIVDLSGLAVGECLEASDGRQALDLLSLHWVDIILTDVNMPTMDGEQLVLRLQADELLRTIPVLVVSTDASEHRVGRMISLGAAGYVKKPFSPETLRKRMEELLGVCRD
jgi:two-component system chemotaxis response regulator CheY